MTTVHVSFDQKVYDVKINSQLHHRIGKEISDAWSPRKIVLLTDSHVGPLYLTDTQKQLEQAGFDVLPLQVPAGETSKSLVVAGELISQMAEAGFTRGDGLIALVSDVAI